MSYFIWIAVQYQKEKAADHCIRDAGTQEYFEVLLNNGR